MAAASELLIVAKHPKWSFFFTFSNNMMEYSCSNHICLGQIDQYTWTIILYYYSFLFFFILTQDFLGLIDVGYNVLQHYPLCLYVNYNVHDKYVLLQNYVNS